jgi:hypothetical protein
MSPLEVATWLGSPRNKLFAVMDSRSVEDDTVLLVTTTGYCGTIRKEGAGLQTVRVSFEWA